MLNGWILPIGGASAVEDPQSTGLPCLVLNTKRHTSDFWDKNAVICQPTANVEFVLSCEAAQPFKEEEQIL